MDLARSVNDPRSLLTRLISVTQPCNKTAAVNSMAKRTTFDELQDGSNGQGKAAIRRWLRSGYRLASHETTIDRHHWMLFDDLSHNYLSSFGSWRVKMSGDLKFFMIIIAWQFNSKFLNTDRYGGFTFYGFKDFFIVVKFLETRCMVFYDTVIMKFSIISSKFKELREN